MEKTVAVFLLTCDCIFRGKILKEIDGFCFVRNLYNIRKKYENTDFK